MTTSLPTNTTLAYTPLESFLLFSYLQSHGVDHAAFRNISALLQENPNVRADPKFDVGRLSADALSDFYLRLLKDEARSELDRQNGTHEEDTANLDPAAAASGPRKRKAPSPSLPTVEEASKNTHLVPQLIGKLYARFRSRQVREIREQERRYDELQREVREIEQGRWNERLQREIQKGQWDTVLVAQAGAAKGQKNGGTASVEAGPSREGNPHLQVTQPQPAGGALPDMAVSSATSAQAGSSARSALGSAGASPAPRNVEAKSPAPKPGVMPPPSLTQRLAPQPSPSPPVHPSQQATPPGQPSRPAGSAQVPGSQRHVPPHVSPAGTPHAQYPKGSPVHGALPAGSLAPPYAQPPAQNAYPRPPHQQPGYRPSRVGGIELPPFQINSTPARPPPQQLPPPPGFSPVPPPGQNAQPFIRQADGRMVPLPPPQMLDGIVGGLRKNFRHAYGQKTRWKTSTGGLLAELPAPQRESLSPPPSTSSSKPLKDRKQRPIPSAEHDPDIRRGLGRTRRTRGGSVASSAVPSSLRSRTRSQSVTSHMSVDNESTTGRRVKYEPGTPMDDDVSASIEASPSGPQHRSRRVTAQLNQASRKRRRSVRGTSEASEHSHEPLGAPRIQGTHVRVSRNFARTCQPVLNDILSHKHASLFSNAVKERDAPGYSDVILRPQDFKSIRKAISDGSRTVAAALSDAAFPTSSESPAPGTASGHVLLPVSTDLVPPKAIVNSSQLEKEITRVFANAAMYNIGEDPVVLDAREMFESVQRSLSDWRSVERTTAAEAGAGVPIVLQRQAPAQREVDDSDADELAGDGAANNTGKRRRLG